MIYYTGVGARDIPNSMFLKLQVYASVFATLGFILRSGGANGADTAVEIGADSENGCKEIYLPWKGFNNNTSEYFNVSPQAFEIAKEIYGQRWDRLSSGVKSMMSRNIHQVLGQNLDTPSKFVLCWTPDGARTAKDRSRVTGGTGQAIACASLYDIPVFNLFNEVDADLLLDFIGELKY